MVESINVTMKRISTNGWLSSLSAFSQATLSMPSTSLRGGVWGSVRLNAASTREMIPATMKTHLVSDAPAFSLSRKMKGQLTTIQPIVPPMRTKPKSLAGSLRLAKASEFVTEIVGT